MKKTFTPHPVNPALDRKPRVKAQGVGLTPFEIFGLVMALIFSLLLITNKIGLINLNIPSLSKNPATISIQVQEIIEQIQKEIIPEENSVASYGISFNTSGYNLLLEYEKSIQLDTLIYQEKLVNLDVLIPCCGFEKIQEDYSQNCQCGHHLALYGLAKYLAQQNYQRAEIQKAINDWKHYFFPKEYIVEELEKRAILNPELNKVLEELQIQGGC